MAGVCAGFSGAGADFCGCSLVAGSTGARAIGSSARTMCVGFEANAGFGFEFVNRLFADRTLALMTFFGAAFLAFFFAAIPRVAFLPDNIPAIIFSRAVTLVANCFNFLPMADTSRLSAVILCQIFPVDHGATVLAG